MTAKRVQQAHRILDPHTLHVGSIDERNQHSRFINLRITCHVFMSEDADEHVCFHLTSYWLHTRATPPKWIKSLAEQDPEHHSAQFVILALIWSAVVPQTRRTHDASELDAGFTRRAPKQKISLFDIVSLEQNVVYDKQLE